jgi:hypothetical protein
MGTTRLELGKGNGDSIGKMKTVVPALRRITTLAFLGMEPEDGRMDKRAIIGDCPDFPNNR